jgi:hypothetical protein
LAFDQYKLHVTMEIHYHKNVSWYESRSGKVRCRKYLHSRYITNDIWIIIPPVSVSLCGSHWCTEHSCEQGELWSANIGAVYWNVQIPVTKPS